MTRILIADDEEALREQLAQALQAAWPEARIVARGQDGADAWDLWLEHQPDVCFLDIRMPGLSGLEVAQAPKRVARARVGMSRYRVFMDQERLYRWIR